MANKISKITYIIDGNNLIGQMRDLSAIQKKDPQGSREKLALILDRYFSKKRVKVHLHFDGYANLAIKSFASIIYSDNKPADNNIKKQIESINNKKLITVISSDGNILEFARVCSCNIMKSEDFAKLLNKNEDDKSEEKIINSITNEEIKKMFNVD